MDPLEAFGVTPPDRYRRLRLSVDAGGLIRRSEVDATISAQGSSLRMRMSVTTHDHDGSGVEAPPPPDRVFSQRAITTILDLQAILQEVVGPVP